MFANEYLTETEYNSETSGEKFDNDKGSSKGFDSSPGNDKNGEEREEEKEEDLVTGHPLTELSIFLYSIYHDVILATEKTREVCCDPLHGKYS